MFRKPALYLFIFNILLSQAMQRVVRINDGKLNQKFEI